LVYLVIIDRFSCLHLVRCCLRCFAFCCGVQYYSSLFCAVYVLDGAALLHTVFLRAGCYVGLDGVVGYLRCFVVGTL